MLLSSSSCQKSSSVVLEIKWQISGKHHRALFSMKKQIEPLINRRITLLALSFMLIVLGFLSFAHGNITFAYANSALVCLVL